MFSGGLSPASGESMLTGSPPTGSYVSPANLTSPGSPKSRFLPPYLLGPPQHSTPSESPRRYQSQFTGGMASPAMAASPAAHHHVTWSPDLIQRIPPSPQSSAASSNANRFGGPPVKSLDLTDVRSGKESTFSIPLERLDSSRLTTSTAANLTASQMDPFYTQGDDFDPATDVDDTWVTVFGFPPDSANFILKEFATYGTIVQHEFASKGNWVHIKYQSPIQARKALSKNGHLYAQSTIRVGVSPCIDKDVMCRYRRKTTRPLDSNDIASKRMKISETPAQKRPTRPPPVSSLLFPRIDTSTPYTSPLPSVSRLGDFGLLNSPANGHDRSSRLGSMRSLTAAYDNNRIPDRSEQQHVANGTNGGLLTKAWKYFFNS